MLLRDLLQRRVEERPVPFSASLAGFKEDPSHFIQVQLIYNYSGKLHFYEVDLYNQHRTLEPDEIVKVISVNLPPNKGISLIILIQHFLYTI